MATRKKKPVKCKAPKRRATIGKGKKQKVVCRTPPKKKQTAAKPKETPAKVVGKPTPPAVSVQNPVPTPPAVVVPPAPPAPAVPATPEPSVPAPEPGITFGVAQAERLLWRAGFGPKPGQAAELAAMGLDAAVRSLVYPTGAAQLIGPEPHDEGEPLAPRDLWGHDHTWWLDRMVRTNQPLVERMTLVWHDWFATSRQKVQVNLMLDQNALLRRHALGNFTDLLTDITTDPAMLDWLDGIRNRRWDPNENYAREVMELFALGANRDAYTERDIREAARALTGWEADWSEGVGLHSFRFVADYHDTGSKTIFGQSGTFGWRDVLRLCLEHPQHPSWVVHRLWSSFMPEDPDTVTRDRLVGLYVSSGRQVAPVVEAILKHPRFYEGPAMILPPVVLAAGLLRATGQYVTTNAYMWLCSQAGQVLFEPPDVSGWDEDRWMSTSTWTGRWQLASAILRMTESNPWPQDGPPYSATEDVPTALSKALASLGNPTLAADTLAELRRFAENAISPTLADWEHSPTRAMRQNALRTLIATCSEMQAH